MKTSNKIIFSTGILLFLSIITYTFMMRGAYQEALKNPVSSEVKIGLKTVKYLNLEYDGDIIFKKGDKFEIIVDRDFKDSVGIVYKNDGLNLDVSKLGEVTIFLPEFPEMNFTREQQIRYKDGNAIDEKQEDYRTIYIDKSFQSGNFVATFLNNANLHFTKCQFDKIDVKGKENVSLTLEASTIKQFNANLVKSSTLSVNYSTIQSKNIVLGDDCSVNIVGKESRAMFLK
ncbi:MAG: hypothetical protein U5N85_03830 [Arcicella sp.]|nr:hypothetical protein [Arcicella sp.]